MNTRRMLLRAAGGAALAPALAHAGAAQRPGGTRAGYFPDAVLTTHEGKRVKFYDDLIRGRVVAINMMYAACTSTCPADTANLLKLQQALGDRVGRDIFMYSLTLMPEMDTPQALNDYVRRYGIGPGWTFLTGGRADIEVIRRKLGFYSKRAEEDADLAQHTGMLRIGNDALDRWCMAPAQSSPKQLVNTILGI